MSHSRTANPWLSDFDYYDPSYFQSALKQNNIYDMDYHVARIFNTPKYCNDLLDDFHGQIETSSLKLLPTIKETYSSSQTHLTSISITIEALKSFINNNYKEKDRTLAIKGLSWFLISTSLITSVKDVDDEISEYCNILFNKLTPEYPSILFFHLIELCDTRFSAEKSRKFINTAVKSLTL